MGERSIQAFSVSEEGYLLEDPTPADIIEHLQEDGRERDAWEVCQRIGNKLAGPWQVHPSANEHGDLARGRMDCGNGRMAGQVWPRNDGQWWAWWIGRDRKQGVLFETMQPAMDFVDEQLRKRGHRLVPNEDKP